MRRSVLVLVALLALAPIPGARAQSRDRFSLDPLGLAGAAAAVSPRSAPLPLRGPHSFGESIELDMLPAIQARAVGSVLSAVGQAVRMRRQAWSSVEPGSITRVLQQPSLSARLLAPLDRGELLAAQALMADVVADSLSTLRQIKLDSPTCFEGNLLCIGTDGDDTWTDDVQILIDPAGDDTYLNNAGGSLQTSVVAASGGCVLGGGSTGRGRPNLECSPAPSTICTYDTLNHATGRADLPEVGLPGHQDPSGPSGGNGTDGSCGSDERQQRFTEGILDLENDPDARAVTLLIDAAGADRYTVAWGHDDPLFNLIEDCFPGEADAVNTNRDFIQGSSLAGIALTWDGGEGDDIFRGRLNAQGSGHIGGVGMLMVQGTGDTTFWADRLSQGSGTAAGIGILANSATGLQRYLLDPPQVYRNEFAPNSRGCQAEGRGGQGQGGFGGVGVLITDGGASSSYRAVTHVTENVYPFRAVLDSSGAPKLVKGTDSQGSGESFPITATSGGIVAGVGILIDRTNGDTRTCTGHQRAGMFNGSSTSTGIDLASIGVIDNNCGKFNLPNELNPVTDPATAIQRLSAGVLGLRMVLPR